MTPARPARFALLLLPVIGLTLAAHWPLLSAQAITADDHQYLIDNSLVRNPCWHSAGRFFSEVLEPSTVGGYYQPLAMISLMLDVALGGRADDLRVIHRTSLLLHVVNVCLIAVLLRMLFASDLPAIGAALVFAVHPLTVEPIAWISDRKTLLAAMFVFLCLMGYLRYVHTKRRTMYAMSLACFVAALLSKPTSTPVPLVLILLDAWPLRRLGRAALLEKLPFVAIAAASAIITLISQERTASLARPEGQGPIQAALIACHNIIFYLGKILWPANLSRIYPFPRPLSLANGAILAGVILTPLLIAALLALRRRAPALCVGFFIFLAAIFPTLGVIGFTNVVAGDKYVYLPAIGLLISLAYYLARQTEAPGSVPSRIAFALLAVAVAAETLAAHTYARQWRDTPTLLAHMLRQAPEEAALHFDLGFWRQSVGRVNEAEQHYREALKRDPRLPNAHINLGLLLADRGLHTEALGHYRAVLESNPRSADALSNIALSLIALGQVDEAIRACEEALSYKPGFAPAHNNLGMALGMQGRLDDAVVHFQAALTARPDFDEAARNLAAACWRQGRMADAAAAYQNLTRRNPRDASLRKLLGAALEQSGHRQQALAEYREALRLAPDDAATAQRVRELEAR